MNQQTQNPPPRRNNYELDERAAEATFLLNHPMLREVFEGLAERYMAQISASAVGSEDLMAAHAKFKVLHEVKSDLQGIVNDKKMADKRGIKYGQ